MIPSKTEVCVSVIIMLVFINSLAIDVFFFLFLLYILATTTNFPPGGCGAFLRDREELCNCGHEQREDAQETGWFESGQHVVHRCVVWWIGVGQ